jgi:hypothetical protein
MVRRRVEQVADRVRRIAERLRHHTLLPGDLVVGIALDHPFAGLAGDELDEVGPAEGALAAYSAAPAADGGNFVEIATKGGPLSLSTEPAERGDPV